MKPGIISYKIMKTRQGLDTLVVSSGGKEYPLHSTVNPERDAGLFRGRLDPARYDFLIVLGTGLGYHLLPVREEGGGFRQIILIDILDGISRCISRNSMTSFLMEDSRVTLVEGQSVHDVEIFLAGAMDMDRIKGVSVLEHPASIRVFTSYYDKIKKVIEKLIAIKAGNRATREAFGGLFVRNILKNIGSLGRMKPVRGLYGCAENCPAIVIGSGPSLDEQIPLLKKHKDRAFLIAVDSALPALLGSGISPDMVISIDPQPYCAEHFLNCDMGGAVPVFSISSCPAMVEKYGGCLSLNSHPFAQLTEKVYGDSIGSVDSSTGSVAGDAVNLCLKCGFRAVGLIGLDFSFSDYRIYARGTAYQRRYAGYFQDRFSTVEGSNARYILKSSGGLRHEGKFTRRSFRHYQQALEMFIEKNGISNLYSLNPRGLPLQGVPLMDIGEYMERFSGSGPVKKELVKAAWSRSARIDPDPLVNALKSALGTGIFDGIMEASLGAGAIVGKKERFQRMILNMKK